MRSVIDSSSSISNTSNNKVELRARFAAIAEKTWAAQDTAKALVEKLKFILPAGGTVAGFVALKDEPNLAALYDDDRGRFVFPRVEGDDLKFYRPKSADALIPGKWGLLEPDPARSEAIDAAHVEVFLVPGLAFDRKLFRLGRGRGFYDRTLAKSKALRVGVAATAQISSVDIEHEEHDCPMDILVTENFLLQRSRAG